MLKTKQLLLVTFFLSAFFTAFGQPTTADSVAIYPAEIVDTKPIYQGGETAMYTFLGQNIKFPMDARQQVGNIGSAYICFVIDENGHLDSNSIKFLIFKIVGATAKDKTITIKEEIKLDKVQAECVVEAKRVVGLLKNWTPAQMENKPVKCRKTLPIGFKNEGVLNRK